MHVRETTLDIHELLI